MDERVTGGGEFLLGVFYYFRWTIDLSIDSYFCEVECTFFFGGGGAKCSIPESSAYRMNEHWNMLGEESRGGVVMEEEEERWW